MLIKLDVLKVRHIILALKLMLIGLLIQGCQNTPTRVFIEQPIQSASISVSEMMKRDPVIVDARSFFDYSNAHAPYAVFIDWRDLQNPRDPSLLDPDLDSLAKRLALKGIHPTRPVLVMGYGLKGNGAEGRIAWVLKQLGVKEVYLILETDIRLTNKTNELNTANAASWFPKEYHEKKPVICPKEGRLLWFNSDEGQSECPVEFVHLQEWISDNYRLLESKQKELKANELIVIGPKQNPRASLLAFVLREAGMKNIYLY